LHETASLLADALSGRGAARPLAGVSWLPEPLLAQLAPGAVGPARGLARVVADAGLDFAFVPAEAEWAPDAARALNDEGLAVAWAVPGPLWPVLERRGLTRSLPLTAKRPEALTDDLVAELARVAEDVRRGLACGAAAIVLAEDLACDAGPLVPPDYAISHAIPALAEAVAIAHDAGAAAVIHSDGDTRPLLDAVLQTGFTAMHVGGGLHEDRAAMLFDELARRGITIVGGLPGILLESGGAAAAQRASGLVAAARAGTLVVADDGGLVTPKAFRALGRLAGFVRERASRPFGYAPETSASS
jgi:hypothetical protein